MRIEPLLPVCTCGESRAARQDQFRPRAAHQLRRQRQSDFAETACDQVDTPVAQTGRQLSLISLVQLHSLIRLHPAIVTTIRDCKTRALTLQLSRKLFH